MKFEGVVFSEESFDDRDTCSIVPMNQGAFDILGNLVLSRSKSRLCGFSSENQDLPSLPVTGDRVKISVKVVR